MGRHMQEAEAIVMTCHNCDGEMIDQVTDLPFKLNDRLIVIIKSLPVVHCPHCNQYLLADAVMERVERLLSAADRAAELEILRYAA